MIGDIGSEGVNHWWSARCHIRKSVYTGHDTWQQHRNISKNTQEHYSYDIFQGNLDFIFWNMYVQLTK